MIRTLHKVIGPITKTLNVIGTSLIAGVMLLVSLDVLLRVLFNRPIKGAVELGGLTVVTIAFMGMAYAERQGAHVRVDLFVSRLRLRSQLAIGLVTTSASLAIVLIIVWQSMVFAMEGLRTGQVLDTLQWPVFPFRLIVPVGGSVLCLEIVLRLLSQIARIAERGNGHE